MLSKYVIERRVSGIGKGDSATHLAMAAGKSNAALKSIGTGVQWLHSYVTDDTIYCVYVAENEELIRRHAQVSWLSCRSRHPRQSRAGPRQRSGSANPDSF